MAINVTTFMVSNDMSSIQLDISLASGTVTSLKMWNETTYKSATSFTDLSSLLAGTSTTESITITPGNLGTTGTLSGMYFLEVEASNGDIVVVATINLTQYYILQARLIANTDLSCLSCNANFQNALLFDLYLEATKQALLIGRFRDAINNLKKLIITTDSSNCSECDDIEALVSTAGNIVSVGVLDCILTTA